MTKLLVPLLFLSCQLFGRAHAAESMIETMQSFIDSEEISGAVTLVVKNGTVLSFEAVGYSDLDSGREMRKDDMFAIASMTKPLVGVALLMLEEEGKLKVTDPVEKYLPEFGELWLLDDRSWEKERILKKPNRKITLFDLLTHTSGIGHTKPPRPDTNLGELVAQISQKPLLLEPGSRWKYSSSGISVLGRIIEVITKQRFEDYISERILDPLGMVDTTFFPKKEDLERVATMYFRNGDMKGLEKSSVTFSGLPIWDTKRTVKPSGGLFSSADDMRRFYQMMLNGGEFEGARFISEQSVKKLTRTQTKNIKTGFTEGMSWGLSFQVVKEPIGVTSDLSKGTFGHGGAYGTQSWADPSAGTIYILMIQRRGFESADNSVVRRGFQTAAKALVE